MFGLRETGKDVITKDFVYVRMAESEMFALTVPQQRDGFLLLFAG